MSRHYSTLQTLFLSALAMARQVWPLGAAATLVSALTGFACLNWFVELISSLEASQGPLLTAIGHSWLGLITIGLTALFFGLAVVFGFVSWEAYSSRQPH